MLIGIISGQITTPTTATPSVTIGASTTNTVSFTITNNDALSVITSYEIREGTTAGTLRGSSTNLSQTSGQTTTVTSSSVSSATLYHLVGVSSIASGKERSLSPGSISTRILTSTPTTATVSSTTSAVTFRITNNDVLSATVSWQIRQGSAFGFIVNSGDLNLSSGSNNTVSATGLNELTTYFLTSVIATANGKFGSAAGVERSIQTGTSQVTATFDSAGGSQSYDPQSGSPGFTVTSPGNPTRSGFTFNGWSPSLPRTISSNTTFTAQWVSDTVTATFDSAGGSQSYDPQSGSPGFTVTSPGSPTRSGFTFNGWSPSLPRTISSNTTFTAQWTAVVVTVTATFDSAGGSPTYNNQSGTSPLSVSNPGSPTRSGFTFNAWSPSLPRQISSNTTFTAQWTAVTLTTSTPSILFVNAAGGSVSWDVRNNDSSTATLYTAIGNATPESGGQTASRGPNQSAGFFGSGFVGVIYAKAEATGKSMSALTSANFGEF
jgi:hypothetical protein